MINTLLNGVVSVSITVVNWFLTPIYNFIDTIDLGSGTLTNLVSNFNSFITTATQYLGWVIDATGIPKPLIVIIIGVLGYCIMLRFRVYLFKLILKYWDRIIA